MASRRVWQFLIVSSILILASQTAVAESPTRNTAITAQPTPLLGGKIPISEFNNVQYEPAVAYNSKHNEYLVVWRNSSSNPAENGIFAQRITENGELIGPQPIPIATGAPTRREPAVAYDPVHDRYLVVWMFDINQDGSDWNINGRFIPWENSSPSLAEFEICTYFTAQWHPKVEFARAVEEFLVVWADKTGTKSEIDGIRVKADGSGLIGFPFIIHTSTRYSDFPDVAYNLARNEYLVVWDEEYPGTSYDIRGKRATGIFDHTFTGDFGIATWPDPESRPAVAACEGADQYLVTWESEVSANNLDVYLRYLSGDGSVQSVHHVEGTAAREEDADVACNAAGNQYLVIWQQQYSSLSGPYGISGRIYNPDTTSSSAFSLITPTGGVNTEFTLPAVAGGKTSYFGVWQHERAGTAFQDIYGRLIYPYSVFLPLLVK